MGGESYHFSTIIGVVPTDQEIAAILNGLKANPLGSLNDVLDMAAAELTFAGKCQLTVNSHLLSPT